MIELLTAISQQLKLSPADQVLWTTAAAEGRTVLVVVDWPAGRWVAYLRGKSGEDTPGDRMTLVQGTFEPTGAAGGPQ